MARRAVHRLGRTRGGAVALAVIDRAQMRATFQHLAADLRPVRRLVALADLAAAGIVDRAACAAFLVRRPRHRIPRSEEHTSELQSLMRISYAVFCLKKKKQTNTIHNGTTLSISNIQQTHIL